MKNNDEVFLTENQLKGLEKLANITFDEKGNPCENLSWLGKLFVWIDTNILSKTTKFWLYLLEIVGVVVIFIIVGKTEVGLDLVINAKTEIDIAKAKMYIESLTALAPSIAGMVATISGALPIVIGTLRSLSKKWANGKPTNTRTKRNELKESRNTILEQEEKIMWRSRTVTTIFIAGSGSAGNTVNYIFTDGSIQYYETTLKQSFKYALIDNIGSGEIRVCFNRPTLDISSPVNGAKTLKAGSSLYIEETVQNISIYYVTDSTIEFVLKSDKKG